MSSPKTWARGPKTFTAPLMAAVTVGGILLAGCSDSSFSVPEPLDAEEVQWASGLGIQLEDFDERPSGLRVRVDEEGEDGTPAGEGDHLSVDYDGWLPDGRLFDSSQTRGPLRFRLGFEPRYIPGFEEGIIGMQVNEVRTLLIPPALGYGPTGFGAIPPNSWIVFRLQLNERTDPPAS